MLKHFNCDIFWDEHLKLVCFFPFSDGSHNAMLMVQQGLFWQGKAQLVRLVLHKVGKRACPLRIRQWYSGKV